MKTVTERLVRRGGKLFGYQQSKAHIIRAALRKIERLSDRELRRLLEETPQPKFGKPRTTQLHRFELTEEERERLLREDMERRRGILREL